MPRHQYPADDLRTVLLRLEQIHTRTANSPRSGRR